MGEYFTLSFSMYGLAIVISLLVAVLIKGIVLSLGMVRKPASVEQTPSTAAPVDETEDDIAVIAAAVYAAMGGHRIVHIESKDRGFSWKAEGRALHHASHNITRRSRS